MEIVNDDNSNKTYARKSVSKFYSEHQFFFSNSSLNSFNANKLNKTKTTSVQTVMSALPKLSMNAHKSIFSHNKTQHL